MSIKTAHPAVGAAELEVATRRLYNAELALHDAHASGVDAWIAAANDRLHEAVVEHLRVAAR